MGSYGPVTGSTDKNPDGTVRISHRGSQSTLKYTVANDFTVSDLTDLVQTWEDLINSGMPGAKIIFLELKLGSLEVRFA